MMRLLGFLFAPRVLPALLLCFAGLPFAAPRASAAPVFSVPGFVDESVYLGNGMISLAFDHEGNLLVTEKQGRVLLLKKNTNSFTPSFAYQYYEGTWTALPDFSALTPAATGVVSSISLEPRLRNDNFALVFTGELQLPASGQYTFYTRSDDGSRIFVNDTLVVNHDGLHGATELSGNITLAAGTHTLRVEYFEAGGGEALEVSYAGPDQPKQVVGANSGPFLPPTVFADIVSQVNPAGERGLLGFTLDPDYANNRYLYLLFSTNTDQRLVRYTANPAFTAVEPGSELTLLSGLPNANNVHKAGDIAFRPGEPYNLYVMLGDDGDRYVVGNLDLYAGKLLRIDSSTGFGLPDNPHYDGNPASVRSRVFSHRYRNPFRFAFDPANTTGDARLYISENGDGTDRIVRIEKGADGGWDPQFLTDAADGSRKILYTTQPSITAIAFLRGGPFAPDGPMLYSARYGGNDRKEVRRWRVTGAELDTLEALPEDNGDPFLTGFTSFNIVSFTQGPDGALYFTDSSQGASTGTGYRLGRIRYVGGEAPVAAFTVSPDPAVGAAPLNVSFTDASTASDAAIAQWSWEFGDGATSSSPSPSHTYAAPGVYTVRLTVTDAIGLTHSVTDEVTVVHPVSLTLDARVRDARAAGSPAPLATPTELRLYQADGVTPLPFAGGSGVSENILHVPAGGVVQTTLSVALTGPGMVVSAGEPATDGVASAFAGFALSLSASEQQIAPVFNLAPTLLRGRATDTLGAAAPLDLGVARGVSQIPNAVPLSGQEGDVSGIFAWSWGVKSLLTI
jgi:PKD repeat protein